MKLRAPRCSEAGWRLRCPPVSAASLACFGTAFEPADSAARRPASERATRRARANAIRRDGTGLVRARCDLSMVGHSLGNRAVASALDTNGSRMKNAKYSTVKMRASST